MTFLGNRLTYNPASDIRAARALLQAGVFEFS
jgi:hypothetical protein